MRLFEGGWWAGFLSAVVMIGTALLLLPGEVTRVDIVGIVIVSTAGMALLAWLEVR